MNGQASTFRNHVILDDVGFSNETLKNISSTIVYTPYLIPFMAFRKTVFALVFLCVVPLLMRFISTRNQQQVVMTNEVWSAMPNGVGFRSVGSSNPSVSNPRSLFSVESNITLAADATNGIPPHLASRLASGFYVLPYEVPSVRAAMDKGVSDYLEKYSSKIGTEYSAMFEKLALDEKTRNMMSNHLTCIERARAEAEGYLVQLGMAKNAYDQSVKEILTPDQYQAYRAAEATIPAKRELKAITEFMINEGVGRGLDSEHESVLLAALKQSKQTPELDGPYGRGTRALVGREQILGVLAEDMTRLRSEYATLVEALPKTTDWAVPRENLSQYYGNQILTKQKEIDFVSSDKPPEPPPQPEP